MQCVICGQEPGYNRAVIELFSGAAIGGLCMSCEREEFGRSFQYYAHQGDERCSFCRRDGHVAFPRYVPEPERCGGDVVVRSRVEDEAVAPRVCDEHFHEIAAVDAHARSVQL